MAGGALAATIRYSTAYCSGVATASGWEERHRDIAARVIGKRICRAQPLSVGAFRIAEDQFEIRQQSPTYRPQILAEQRLELGIGRDKLPGHELQVLVVPRRGSGGRHVVRQRRRRMEAAIGFRLLVPQDGPEFSRRAPPA